MVERRAGLTGIFNRWGRPPWIQIMRGGPILKVIHAGEKNWIGTLLVDTSQSLLCFFCSDQISCWQAQLLPKKWRVLRSFLSVCPSHCSSITPSKVGYRRKYLRWIHGHCGHCGRIRYPVPSKKAAPELLFSAVPVDHLSACYLSKKSTHNASSWSPFRLPPRAISAASACSWGRITWTMPPLVDGHHHHRLEIAPLLYAIRSGGRSCVNQDVTKLGMPLPKLTRDFHPNLTRIVAKECRQRCVTLCWGAAASGAA